jgi:hypothetical protein
LGAGATRVHTVLDVEVKLEEEQLPKRDWMLKAEDGDSNPVLVLKSGERPATSLKVSESPVRTVEGMTLCALVYDKAANPCAEGSFEPDDVIRTPLDV